MYVVDQTSRRDWLSLPQSYLAARQLRMRGGLLLDHEGVPGKFTGEEIYARMRLGDLIVDFTQVVGVDCFIWFEYPV